MPQLAQGALATALVLSALGAVLVCVMVVLFGFTGPDDEPPLKTARRLMVTRIGHALATTCFAATAILIAMVLLQSSRAAPPTLAPDARVPELGARVDQQTSRMTVLESRAREASAGVARTESRLRELEQSLGRLADEGRQTEKRVGHLEQSDTRTAAATRASTARKPPAASPAVATRAPEPASPPSPPRAVPAPAPAAMTDRSTSPPPRPGPEQITPPPATSPPPPPMPSASVSTADSPSAAVAPSAPTVTVASKDHAAPAPTSSPSSTSSMPDGLGAKLRQDWAAIQRGFESSRDDVRRAFDGTKRKLRELVQ